MNSEKFAILINFGVDRLRGFGGVARDQISGFPNRRPYNTLAVSRECVVSWKRYKTCPWFLRNVNRKSQVPDRSVSLSSNDLDWPWKPGWDWTGRFSGRPSYVYAFTIWPTAITFSMVPT